MSNTELAVIGAQSNSMATLSRVDPMAFVEKMGKVFWLSGAGGAKNEQQGQVLALACVCEGKHIFELGREFHLIDGKLSMRADAMLARFRERGGKHKWIADGKDGKRAAIELTYDGQTITGSYTIEEAETAKLIKKDGGWERNRPAMLRARAVSEGIRMVAPEVIAGFYTPEENEDIAADSKTAPATTDVKTVKSRAKELKEMNQGNQAAPASAQSGDVVDAEFTDKATETTTTTTASTEAPANQSAASAVAVEPATQPATETKAATEAKAFDPAAMGSSTDATLMEIDMALEKLGMTKERLFAQLQAKNPQIKSIDDLSENAARTLLVNLEKAAEKAAAAKK